MRMTILIPAYLLIRSVTYNFGLKERIVEIMQMHVNMISRHHDSHHTKNQRRVKLVGQSGLNTVLLTVSQTKSRNTLKLRRTATHLLLLISNPKN